MISKLTGVLFLLFCISVQAQQSQWQPVASPGVIEITGKEEVNRFLLTHAGAQKAQQREMAIAAADHLPADPVVRVRETIQYLRWIGPTRCERTDPRLSVITHDYFLETESGNMISTIEGRAEKDPC